MNDGLLLQTVEGLGNSPFMITDGGIWNSLQSLKEEISQDLLHVAPLCQSYEGVLQENDAAALNSRELEWLHRSQLEARLRAINDAQDRLLEGSYGKCVDCDNKIYFARLIADPAVSLCLDCQRIADGEETIRPLHKS
jgi:RNA polymerase-binding transcription factor DksA